MFECEHPTQTNLAMGEEAQDQLYSYEFALQRT